MVFIQMLNLMSMEKTKKRYLWDDVSHTTEIIIVNSLQMQFKPINGKMEYTR